MNSVSQSLAAFIGSYPGPDIPPLVRDRVRTHYVRQVAWACAGANEVEPPIVARTLRQLSPATEVGLLGLPGRLGVCEAPVVNALAMDCASRSDGADPQESVQGPILAAALATAELCSQTLTTCLEAVAIGAEVGLRVEAALQPALSNAGWRPYTVAARLGAAAAAGRLLGLGRPQLVTTLALAATEVAASTSSTVSIGWARAAGDGVEAALLARAGLTGPRAPLEGRRGLAQVLAGAELTETNTVHDLGRRWLVLEDPSNLARPLRPSAQAARLAAESFTDDMPWASLHSACLNTRGA